MKVQPPNPSEVEDLLVQCERLLNKYEGFANATKPAGYDGARIMELRERLAILQSTYRRIVSIVGPAFDAATATFGMHIDQRTDTFMVDPSLIFNEEVMRHSRELDLTLFEMTESFYHTAWRIREMIHPKACGLPGLCGFDASGIRNVRNLIMVHPETAKGPTALWSRGLSREQGPTLGGAHVGTEPPSFADPGLFANAFEFAQNLHTRLSKAIAAGRQTE